MPRSRATVDRYLIISSRRGERYLFASDRGPWQWDIPKKPEYEHFKLLHPYEARRALNDLEDDGLLRRIHDICEGRPNSCLSIALHEVREWLLSHLVELDMNGDPLICLGGGLCVFKEERPWAVSPPAPSILEKVHKPAPLSEVSSWVIVECVTPAGTPVQGVALEIITRAGLVQARHTDEKGQVFLNGIAPGRVTIRVLGIDGGMWQPLEGDSAQPSSGEERRRWHVVQRGESLSKIAHQYGLKSWATLWNEPKNEPLRKKRKNPHLLHPGDQVAVPENRVYEIVRDTDATHRLEISEPMTEFRVVLQNHNRKPFKNEAYELRFPTRPQDRPLAGTSDGTGRIVHQIPAGEPRVQIALPRPGLIWTFRVSHLVAIPAADCEARLPDGRPSEQAIRATQARLNALGIPCGPVDGIWGPKTERALALLRRSQGAPVSDASIDAGEYRAVKSVETSPVRAEGPTGSVRAVTHQKASERELAALSLGRRRIDLPCDLGQLAKLDAAAGAVSALANMLSAALAVRELAAQQDAGIAWYMSDSAQAGAWSTLQAVGSVAQVVQAVRKAQRLPPFASSALVWAERSGQVGGAWEGARSLYDGLKVLYSEESDALAKLDAGDVVGGTLELTKGVGLVAAGIGGLGGGVIGLLGLSLVAGPFALAYGFGLGVVLVAQTSIYTRAGNESRVKPLVERTEKAMRSEFRLTARGRASERGMGTPQLRRRLGVLNAMLSQELPA